MLGFQAYATMHIVTDQQISHVGVRQLMSCHIDITSSKPMRPAESGVVLDKVSCVESLIPNCNDAVSLRVRK